MTYIKLTFGISTAVILAGGAMMLALSSKAAGEDISSDEIFKKAQDNYASLTSYSDEGQIVATMGGTTTIFSFTIRLARMSYYQIVWEQNNESAIFGQKHLEKISVRPYINSHNEVTSKMAKMFWMLISYRFRMSHYKP